MSEKHEIVHQTYSRRAIQFANAFHKRVQGLPFKIPIFSTTDWEISNVRPCTHMVMALIQNDHASLLQWLSN